LVPYETKQVHKPVPRYYSVVVAAEAGLRPESFTQEVNPLTLDAATVLARGKKVVIYPPDRCRHTTAAPAGAEQAQYIEMKCGVLISSLEQQLGLAGFQVISWQVLRSSQKAADFRLEAKKLGVDVIFEIDQLSENDRVSGTTRAGRMDIYKVGPNEKTRQPVARETGLRCKKRVESMLQKLDREELSATLAVKAVEVKSGRAVLYYNKTVLDDSSQKATTKAELFYKANAIYSAPPQMPRFDQKQLQAREAGSNPGPVFIGVGLGLLVVGGAMAAGGGAMLDEGDDAGLALLIPGIMGAAVGFPMWIIGLSSIGEEADYDEVNADAIAWNQRSFPPPRYPDPDQVVCSSSEVTPHWMQKQATVEDSSDSASFSFGEVERGTNDESRRRVERLFNTIAKDFADELLSLNRK
jgi:hypothetical protein